MYVCIYVCIYVCVYIHICIYIYTHMCIVYIYMYMDMYIYIHTHMYVYGHPCCDQLPFKKYMDRLFKSPRNVVIWGFFKSGTPTSCKIGTHS